MNERTLIPASPACGLWETLLADALDGQLNPADEATFNAHKLVCPACAEMYEEAKRGRQWLGFLAPDPEVPAGLLKRILEQTGPGQLASPALAPTMGNLLPMPSIPAWQRPGFMGHVYRYAEPRLLMTAAMAFFSITLTLNLLGVNVTKIRWADLRPSMVRSLLERQIMTASTPIVRYYDHSRLVNELQDRMRALRQSTEDGSEHRPDGGSAPATQQGPEATPGQSRKMPVKPENNAPQQSQSPVLVDSKELQSALQKPQANSSELATVEGGAPWTA